MSAGEAPARVPADWPNRAFSRSVRVGAIDWHVQVAGSGPALLLLHGTGSSAHSWADVVGALAREARVIVPDLPGHGYTTGAGKLSLTAVAQALDALITALDGPRIAVVAGHSAGAVVALRWALLAQAPPSALVGFNPSLVAPPALYTLLLAPWIARVATSSPFAGGVAALARRTALVPGLLDSTRSAVPQAQRERYAALFRRPDHVQGTMRFMAAADVGRLLADASALAIPATFVVGRDDPWVPERPLLRAIGRALPQATIVRWDGGHVLHEADPQRAARLLLDCAAREAP